MIYSPRALPEGNKSHNPELKADKWLIFTLARIPQGMQKYNEEKLIYIECAHGGHIGGAKQLNDFPLGNKLQFYANVFYCFAPPTWPP